jgi:hypothetical protein
MDTGENRMVEGIHGPSFHNMLAIQPHHPHSTKPYMSEGGYVMEWHSLAVISARATESKDIAAMPLKRIFGREVPGVAGIYPESVAASEYLGVAVRASIAGAS